MHTLRIKSYGERTHQVQGTPAAIDYIYLDYKLRLRNYLTIERLNEKHEIIESHSIPRTITNEGVLGALTAGHRTL